MQLGYSNLLQEFVGATEVAHGDCAVFQVVCPNCREAIFKAGTLGGDRQYLSHYAASKSNVKDCEFRVGRISLDQIRTANIQGHAQTIEAFFGSFQQSVLRWLYPDDPEIVRKKVIWMSSRPSFITYSLWVASILQMNEVEKLWHQLVDDLAADESDYWAAQQKRFALDFLQHLLAPNSKSAWHFVCALAIFIDKAIVPEIQHELLYANDIRLKRMLRKLRNALIPSDEKPLGITLQNHTTYSHSHILGVRVLRMVIYLLLCIPYTDLLAGTEKMSEHNRQILEELSGQ